MIANLVLALRLTALCVVIHAMGLTAALRFVRRLDSAQTFWRFIGVLIAIAITYTTVGYGDLVLPRNWRLVGGIEALTGIIMCGWPSSLFSVGCIELRG